MIYTTLNEQFISEKTKNEELMARIAEQSADMDYIAMMCDIELETEGAANEQIRKAEDVL